MPYIITTSEPFDAAVHTTRPAFTRRAVATLEEAREAVHDEINCDTWGSQREYVSAALALPESGGTIGPLPDGTVIEVAPITWLAMLAGMSGARARAIVGNDAAVIDAYNARESR